MSAPRINLGRLEGWWDAETSTVGLDIPREWCFWSGDYNGGPGAIWKWEDGRDQWKGLADPMDEDGYDEADALFHLKPNIEVLWPARCYPRKQRGWYHVKPWPSRLLGLPVESDSRPALATAVDIPPELFQRIIIGTAYRQDRHALAVFGQVCRYWASQCRPRLFEYLHLRSRQDVLSLRDFKRDPACRFLRLCCGGTTFHAEVAGLSERNWIHLFARISDGHPWPLLFLKGPLPAGMNTLCSIHQAIPRSLPCNFSCKIVELRLADIHFRRFEDFVHLVGELPDLAWLHCTKVTWDSLPTELPRRRPTVDRDRLKLWSLEECSHLRPQAAIFLLHKIYSPASDYDDLFSGLSSLLETLELGNAVSIGIDWPDGNRSDSSVRQLFLHYGRLKFKLSAEPHNSNSVPGGRPSFHLTASAIKLGKVAKWAFVNWGKFDRFVVKFACPRRARVVLGFKDRKHMLRFAEDIASKQMPLSSRRNLITYAIPDSDSYLWRQASPDSKELRGPGHYSLHDVHA